MAAGGQADSHPSRQSVRAVASAPRLPRGKSAFLEKLNPRKTRPARILTSGGSVRKKPTRHDHSTAQLSRLRPSAAEANSSQSAAHWLRAQGKGTSDSGELLRHERNKSKLREKGAWGTKTEKQPVHLIPSCIQRQGNMYGIHEIRTRCHLKISK